MSPVFTDLPGKESKYFWYRGVDCWLQPHQINTTFSSDTQNTKQIKKNNRSTWAFTSLFKILTVRLPRTQIHISSHTTYNSRSENLDMKGYWEKSLQVL